MLELFILDKYDWVQVWSSGDDYETLRRMFSSKTHDRDL